MSGGTAFVDFGDARGDSTGDRNVATAWRVFADRGIGIVGKEVAGGGGRTIHVETSREPSWSNGPMASTRNCRMR
ncbi:MAG: hypothetical protein ACQET5_04135 [Halobacteriota archaeon]|uniref:hypothetical protein n=1 Tax=Natronomonas sp. TaxID=2184060 RepID=UPI00397596C3